MWFRYVPVCLLLISVIFCKETENYTHNRPKRTVGLILQSLASFLNVRDETETTTPVTFTTTFPGYRRKSPPPKVEKWPPLDLEITPWVLQAVPPTTAAPPTTTPYPLTTVYPYTEDPNIKTQVIIIPLPEPENHLNFEIKNDPISSLKHELPNGQQYKGAPMTYGNYQSLQRNPVNPQADIFYFQRITPGKQRIGKESSNQQPVKQQQNVLQPQQNQQQLQRKQILDIISFLQNNSNNLNIFETINATQQPQVSQDRISGQEYLQSHTINEGLFNMAGNDFNREIQDKFRYFIDLEPKLRYAPRNNNPSKNNHLSQLYLLERNKHLKNVSNGIKLLNNKMHKQNVQNNDEKTNVEIVKSIEPEYVSTEDKPVPLEEINTGENKDDLSVKDHDSSTFQLIKSYEIPEFSINQKNDEFVHIDSEENPHIPESDSHDHESKLPVNSNTYYGNVNQNIKNGKIKFISPAERENFHQRKQTIGQLGGKNINQLQNNPTTVPDKIYQDVYESKFDGFIESFNSEENAKNPNSDAGLLSRETFAKPNPFNNFNILNRSQLPRRGNVKYNYPTSNNQHRAVSSPSNEQSETPHKYFNAGTRDATNVNPHLFQVPSADEHKGFNYFNNFEHGKQYNLFQQGQDPGTQFSSNLNGNYPLPNTQDAQVHIFIPEEDSLNSPEKHTKDDSSQFQFYNSPDYQDYFYNSGNKNDFDPNGADEGFTRGSLPRLPDKIHEQLTEQNEVRRNLASPSSFDLQADMSEHNTSILANV